MSQQRRPDQSHVCSLSINTARLARKIGKNLSEKEQNSRRDRQEILMTSFRQRLYLFFCSNFFFFSFITVDTSFLSFLHFFLLLFPICFLIDLFFFVQITHKKSLYVGGFTCVSVLHFISFFFCSLKSEMMLML